MTPPYTIDTIDHVVIGARDIDVMLTFYRDVLGCRLAKANTPLGLYHLRAGLSMIDLVDVAGTLGRAGGAAPPEAGVGGRNVDHVALRVTPFDEAAIRAHL
ncbi:MAG: VOC family protein, partial [Rhodospirillaceae bacterium]